MPVGEPGDFFAGIEADVPEALAQHLRQVAVIDHCMPEVDGETLGRVFGHARANSVGRRARARESARPSTEPIPVRANDIGGLPSACPHASERTADLNLVSI